MSLPHLLMGLINVEPITGYDLNKRFERGVQNFWTVSQSQIYRALHRMEKDGWVEVEMVVQEGSPNKKVYQLTETGRTELLTWLSQPIIVNKDYLPKMGQIFFGDALEREQALQLIRFYVGYYEEIYHGLKDWYDSLQADLDDENLPQHILFRVAPLEHAMRHAKFEAEWYAEMVQRVENNMNSENNGIKRWAEDE